MYKISFPIFYLCIIFSSYSSKKEISLSTNLSGSIWHKNGDLIAETMSNYSWQIEGMHGAISASNEARTFIENREVYFAIIPNNRILRQGDIRAVAPLNQEAMLFLYKDDGIDYISLKE